MLVELVLLLSVVALVAALARRFGLLGPILLVAAGIALSYVPGFPDYELEPELVLAGFLPPLLYVAALDTSVPEFKRNLRPILLLAVGLVFFTTLVVGFVLHWVVPSLPLAACFVLGAVVAPPDAVAATSVARRIGLPRRVVTILEGESLVNDATALTLLRVAVGAATGAGVTWWEVALELVAVAAGGLVVGYVVARIIIELHKRTEDSLLDNTISILTPFVAFAAAESIDASGVIAVVLAGLLIGHRRVEFTSAQSRLQTDAFWRVVEFLLQGVVFLLVGLQIRVILDGLDDQRSVVVASSVAVTLAVILSRFVWMYPATYGARLVPTVRRNDPPPPLNIPTIISWAGMRGVVSLAAAFAIPLDVPQRSLLVWLTFVVILVTLVGQGLTLPTVARLLKVKSDDPAISRLGEAGVQQEATRAALDVLDELSVDLPPEVVSNLRDKMGYRANAAWERLGSQERETPASAQRRARRAMLEAERRVFIRARDEGRIPDAVVRRVQRDLDLEEAMLLRE